MNKLLLELRDKGNTVLVVEHKPETIVIADRVVDLGPGAGTGGGTICFEGTVEGLKASGTLTGRHLDHRAALKDTVRTPTGTARDPRRERAQPAGCRRRRPARRALRRDRRGRVGQELAHPRLDPRRRGRGVDRPGRDQGLAPEQPGDVHGTARADPHRVREGQRREAGAVQRQLGGRLPNLQRQREDLHRARLHGDRRDAVRGLRRQALPGRGAGAAARRAQHRRGARPSGRRGPRLLRRGRGEDPGRRGDPAAPGRRRARLPQARPAAPDAVRRRAAAAQAGHPHGREGRRSTSSTSRPAACTSPTSIICSACSTGSSTPASRSSSSPITRRSWRTPTGSSTSVPAPATTAAGSSSRARPPTSSPPGPPSPASTCDGVRQFTAPIRRAGAG